MLYTELIGHIALTLPIAILSGMQLTANTAQEPGYQSANMDTRQATLPMTERKWHP